MKRNILVFDGTSHYVIDTYDLEMEIEENCVTVVERFYDIDQAFAECDRLNQLSIDKTR